jgi:hypothetical protein
VGLGEMYWGKLQEEHGIHPNMMNPFQKLVRERVNNKRRKVDTTKCTKSRMVAVKRHKQLDKPIVSDHEGTILTEEECMVIPYTTDGCMSQQTLETLQALQAKAIEVAAEDIEKSRNKKSETAHTGRNLGTTVVGGGGHCGDGTSKGSYHPGPFLYKKHLSLRLQLQQAISNALNEAFGNRKWFRDLKKLVRTYDEKYGKNITDALIGDTPCTAFFFSTSTCKVPKPHIDKNTHGATFLFCVEDYEGGEINIEVPGTDMVITHHMKPGMILAGRWSRSVHFNNPVAEGVQRYSFICYFDDKILLDGFTWVPKPHWLQRAEKKNPQLAEMARTITVGRKRKKQQKIGENIVVNVDDIYNGII